MPSTLTDQLLERFQEEGNEVYTLAWSSDIPIYPNERLGVLHLDGQYLPYHGDEYEYPVFDTLAEAIVEGEVHWVNSTTRWIECASLAHGKIAALLYHDVDSDPGQPIRLLINDVPYEFHESNYRVLKA